MKLSRFLAPLLLLTACESGVIRMDNIQDESDPSEASSSGALPSDDSPAPPNQPDFADAGTAYGHVVAPAASIPIAGAEVHVRVGTEEVRTYTLGDGSFELQLPPGTWTLTVRKGRYGARHTVEVTTADSQDVGHIPLDPGDVKLAVIHGEWDHVEDLVDDLGIPFDVFPHAATLLDDPATLETYDVVFANCGTSEGVYEGYTDRIVANTRDWVDAGGTLYASDWEYKLVEGVDPSALRFDTDPKSGAAGTITGQILDPEIEALLGSDHAAINYDLGEWVTIDSTITAVPVVLAVTGDQTSRPLAAIHRRGAGRMIYTTFHNEQQATTDMQMILYEMILSL